MPFGYSIGLPNGLAHASQHPCFGYRSSQFGLPLTCRHHPGRRADTDTNFARLFKSSAAHDKGRMCAIVLLAGSTARYNANREGWDGSLELQLAMQALGGEADFVAANREAVKLVRAHWPEITALCNPSRQLDSADVDQQVGNVDHPRAGRYAGGLPRLTFLPLRLGDPSLLKMIHRQTGNRTMTMPMAKSSRLPAISLINSISSPRLGLVTRSIRARAPCRWLRAKRRPVGLLRARPEMTTRARMLALIDTFADESPTGPGDGGVGRSGKNDDAIDADTDDNDAACMDALRRHWPEATDEEIARGPRSRVTAFQLLPAMPTGVPRRGPSSSSRAGPYDHSASACCWGVMLAKP